MKKIILLTVFSLAILSLKAQDEGTAVAQERFELDKSIYVSLGPSFTLGKNLGDYSAGISFEAGFLKRLNRIVSIGPAISFLNFKYDEDKTYPYYYSEDNDEFYELYLKGGNVQLISAGFTIKINVIPVSDNSKFSIYGIGTPFVCNATKKEISSSGTYYFFNTQTSSYQAAEFEVTSDAFEGFKKESNITGGLHAGFGFEFLPAQKISFFGQATFSYTLPINFVSSQEYTEKAFDNNEYYYFPSNPDDIFYDARVTLFDEDFPIVKKGFSAMNLRLGVTFNF